MLDIILINRRVDILPAAAIDCPTTLDSDEYDSLEAKNWVIRKNGSLRIPAGCTMQKINGFSDSGLGLTLYGFTPPPNLSGRSPKHAIVEVYKLWLQKTGYNSVDKINQTETFPSAIRVKFLRIAIHRFAPVKKARAGSAKGIVFGYERE